MNMAIQTHSLTKKFGDIVAVDHLEIKVKENEIYGLVGPDGAGKTTTMRMLCSLLVQDSGSAMVGNYDTISDSVEIIKHIGYMPQRFSLYGDLTVEENLIFYAAIYQVPSQISREKIQHLLKFSNLSEHSYKLADQLSGGMKQKLALACNLIHTPKYLFLDEPTIGVDPVARRELWKILFELREQGVTIFVSTPYMDEAERCDEIGLMNKGKIIKNDNPAKIIEDFQKHIVKVYSGNNYQAKELAGKLDYIEDAYMLGEELRLVVDNFEMINRRLAEDFKGKGIELSLFSRTEPSLEDVFVNTIKSLQYQYSGGGEQ